METGVASEPAESVVTHVWIEVELLNRVIAYMIRQPFADVAELVLPLKIMADESFKAQQDGAQRET